MATENKKTDTTIDETILEMIFNRPLSEKEKKSYSIGIAVGFFISIAFISPLSLYFFPRGFLSGPLAIYIYILGFIILFPLMIYVLKKTKEKYKQNLIDMKCKTWWLGILSGVIIWLVIIFLFGIL